MLLILHRNPGAKMRHFYVDFRLWKVINLGQYQFRIEFSLNKLISIILDLFTVTYICRQNGGILPSIVKVGENLAHSCDCVSIYKRESLL